ncbi:MAG: hypothetical protein M1484_03710 [Patescibacteria group bacterium]|nr:hypothetical protein [Patescibacteria group bacterium]MCL5432167.1 hypothetical protein [Patescibacteria group bacterium]
MWESRLPIVLGVVGFIFAANILLLDFMVVKQGGDLSDFQTRLATLSDSFSQLGNRLATISTAPAGQSPLSGAQPTPAATDNSCPQSCVSLINSLPKTVSVPAASVPAPVSTKGESSVFLGSGSVSQTNNWTDLTATQVTLDTSNFGTIKQAYFEATLHVSSGEVHARLFDATTPAIIWGSEVSSASNTDQYLSVPIALSAGSKTYRVQMYSTITTGYLSSARIRIVTQ